MKSAESVHFPPLSMATPDGLLMVGGRLTPHWLLAAYRRGIFPWPIPTEQGTVLAWFSPDPRAVLEFADLHVSRRLRRRLRRGGYRVSCNEDFGAVIAACAEAGPGREETWITPEMSAAYRQLHELGIAHSVEVWCGERLAGGVYGIALGGMFSGESMFHRMRDGSKIALVHLVQHLRKQGFSLFDVQQSTPHMERMGAREIARGQFIGRLREALDQDVSFD